MSIASLPSPAPSRADLTAAIAKAIAAHVKVDATGLAPAVASHFMIGIEPAAEAIYTLLEDKGVLSASSRLRLLELQIARIATQIERQVKAADGYAAMVATKEEGRPTTWELQNSHFRDLAKELQDLVSET